MPSKSLVSVIIPVFNAEMFLEETIHSVIDQTHDNWELFIVDDGSTDNTSMIAKLVAARDERIKYIYKDNGGVSSARNLGIDLSSGEFLAFLDADDIWKPDFLLACLEKFDKQDWGMVYTDLEVIDGNSKKTGISKQGKEGWLLNDLLTWEQHVISPPSGILVKREAIDTIGSFDTSLSNNADQDFYIRLSAEYEIGHLFEPLLLYRIHTNNMHSDVKTMEKDTIYVFEKAKKELKFETRKFETRCFANMHLILAINFLMHEKNFFKFIFHLTKSLILNPIVFLKRVSKRIYK